MKPSHLLLPPPQMMLKPPLALPKVPSRLPMGSTVKFPRLPGDPSTKVLEPRRTSEVLACLSLLRLTSTNRMSVCTWLDRLAARLPGTPPASAIAREPTRTTLLIGWSLHGV